MRKGTKSPGPYVPVGEVLFLRTSLIKTYLRCPAQCFFRYFKGLVMLPRSYATFGTCTHKTAEYTNAYKKKRKKEPKLSVMQDVFHEEFKVRRKKTWWTKEEKPEKIELEGTKKVVPIYREKIAKKVKPKLVEHPFRLELPKVKAVLTGTIDLVEEDNLIRDLKTKSRIPNWTEVLKSFQGKSYITGHWKALGTKPKGFGLDCIVRTKEPKVVPCKPVKATTEIVNECIDTTTRIVESIRRGEFYPRREGNMFCSPTSCGFWSICTKGQWRNLGVFEKVFGSNEAEEENEE